MQQTFPIRVDFRHDNSLPSVWMDQVLIQSNFDLIELISELFKTFCIGCCPILGTSWQGLGIYLSIIALCGCSMIALQDAIVKFWWTVLLDVEMDGATSKYNFDKHLLLQLAFRCEIVIDVKCSFVDLILPFICWIHVKKVAITFVTKVMEFSSASLSYWTC